MSRVAVITGAARGIGAAIARHFSKLGYEIVVNYNRSQVAAQQLADELSAHSKVLTFQADVSQPAQVDALFQFAQQQLGGLHVLVNNASYNSPVSWNAEPGKINWEEWQ